MRPVIIGDPDDYLFDTKQQEDDNDIRFGADSAVARVYETGGVSPAPAIQESVTFFLNALLDVTQLGLVYPNNLPNYRAQATTNIKNALTRRYREAHPDLVKMIGNFCSFCELPLPNTYLDIEHRAAKSPYPTYFVWWWNFLLACTSCNSIKSDNPDRATTTGWAAAMHPTEEELVDEIKSHYYWPDQDSDTFRIFRFQYFYDTNTAHPIEMIVGEYTSRDNVAVSATLTTVNANVWEAGAMHNNVRVECRLWLNGGGNSAQMTLTLTGIDRRATERSMYRTLAWLACCADLRRLFNAVALVGAPLKDAIFALQWDALLDNAKQRGFYSTWLDILEETAFPAGVTAGGYANLGAKFAFDTDYLNNQNPLQFVPGTDYAEVP